VWRRVVRRSRLRLRCCGSAMQCDAMQSLTDDYSVHRRQDKPNGPNGRRAQ
jgi:hypothetical protein